MDFVRTISICGPTVDQLGAGSLVLQIFPTEQARNQPIGLEFFPTGESDTTKLFHGLKMLPTIFGDTASEGSFAWALNAIHTCLESHTKCNADRSEELPTRLLDLNAFDGRLDIRLIETAGMSASYACLSHCWGVDRHITTESKTLSLRKRSITWTSLPKTFQDAIHYVRRLKLRYLWIDSLCIIQDDSKDWQLESAAMSTIYHNAFVTIAATSSCDDSRGCYSSGTVLDQDLQVGPQFYVREKAAHFDSSQSPSVFSSFPLLTRAWFYQERLLSPRVLHFGPKELLWECEESSGCQCDHLGPDTSSKPIFEQRLQRDAVPGGLETPAESTNHDTAGPSTSHHDEQAERVGERYDSHTSLWHDLVSEYSSLQLTELKDRLPAIAGLSRYFINRAGLAESPQYLSGLWDRSLTHDLLWRVDEPLCGRSEKRNRLGPPSWSWASVNGKASYWAEPFCAQDIKLLSTPLPLSLQATATHGGPHVPSAGLLRVWGRLTPATLSYTRTASGETDPIHYELSYSGRHCYLSTNPFSLTMSEAGRNVPLIADYSLSSDGTDHIEDQTVLYCLGNFVGESFTASLVLRSITQESDQGSLVHYERVGIVAIPHIGRKIGKRYAVGVADASPSLVTLV